jgi:hypothetical protein
MSRVRTVQPAVCAAEVERLHPGGDADARATRSGRRRRRLVDLAPVPRLLHVHLPLPGKLGVHTLTRSRALQLPFLAQDPVS